MIANSFIAEFAPHLASCAARRLRVTPYAQANGSYTEVGALLVASNGDGKDSELCRYMLGPSDRDRFSVWIEEAQAWLSTQRKIHAT